MPRASLRSVLLICAFSTARMCRVSTQITGKPASARALNSHCDNGPASSPIRLKQCEAFIGLEAGPLSQWLFSALAEAGLPVICVETRHMRAVLKAQINKTDRNDARGIAQMMRVGLYRPVHVKTLRSQKLRMLLTHRK